MFEKKLSEIALDARGREIAVTIPVAQANRAVEGAAQVDSGGNQRIENRLQVERRTADDLEHLGGRNLLLQGFAEIVGFRLHLIEQAHIADSDHGLIGESLQQTDLFVPEGIYFEAAKQNRSDALTLAQQGHGQNAANALGAYAARQFLAVGKLVALVGENVTHMHRLAIQKCPPGGP